MTDPTTSNIALVVPTRGSDPGTWDVPVNSNTTALDGYFGGVQTISVSNAPITLTAPSGVITPSAGPTQAQNAVLKITGTLSSNVQITLPLPGYYIIDNSVTVGNFIVTFKAVGSGEIISVPYGTVQQIYNDGTNVRFSNLQPVGTYLDYAGATVPGWITACTKLPYLLCDGSTFSAVTYPVLNVILGGNTLPDFRGRAPYYLNGGTGRLTSAGAGIDGNTIFAVGGNNGITAGQIPSHTHPNTLTDPGHSHLTDRSASLAANATISGTLNPTYVTPNNANTGTSPTGITINNAANAGTTIMQNAAPGAVAGIRMIRAA